ncbi:MAG TPA: sigma-70 family RNA polymerase sigma factor [Gemmatimonadales bacterium]|nr:sigma-70 family RNA polymerase sigma factor [Gemmatimonadales bacterium]
MPAPAPHPLPLDLDALRRGDATALGEVYRRHAGSILGTLRGLLGDEMAAEDVLHDLFVGLPEALGRYEERGLFEAWLRRVAARMALERIRRRKRRIELARSALPTATADADAESLPDRLLVRARLAELPDSLRTVVVLREIEGWPHRDIARFLGLNEGAVMTRHCRGMKRLRLAMERDR